MARLVLALALVLFPAAPAAAQVAGSKPLPIPENPLSLGGFAEFEGSTVAADPHPRLRVPRHPYMARNGASNIHNDAYQSDVYNRRGPLGRDVTSGSALFVRECASVTFDSRGRIVTICVGLDQPVLAVLDPVTLQALDAQPLPARETGLSNPFSNFAGGGYFYLDHRDRAVVPTSHRKIVRFKVKGSGALERGTTFDVSGAVPRGDAIVAVMPDWSGRIWFASQTGVVGFANRAGKVVSRDTGEPIGNSFAVDERGGVYIVSDAALYRFQARRGRVAVVWRARYPNTGRVKPGQTQAGSGTTPTVMGKRWVAITDNADPVAIRVYQRAAKPKGRRLVCAKPVFRRGASSTDQSLIATRRSIIAENNHGYSSIAATIGGTTTPGLERVDMDRDGRGCHRVWRSEERAPSVVPKLSLGSGLVYTYTKPPRSDLGDPWYLTAIDFDTGETRWKALAGSGFGFNNNYAPVTLGPDGAAYVGVLGGLTRLADGR